MLDKYAELAVKTGVNIQRGQGCVIFCEVTQHSFAELVVKHAYEAGAGWVDIVWGHQPIQKMQYQYESVEQLSILQKWEESRWEHYSKELPVRIAINSADPDGLAGVDVEKMQTADGERRRKIKPYRELMENRHQWTIIAVPSVGWAKKVFPNLPEAEAVEKLWECICGCVRVTEDGDAVKAWERHSALLQARANKLSSYKLDHINYKSSNGTDFTCKLIDISRWTGGSELTKSNVRFNPNMPTEEIFITPMKGQCEGTVVATKPLSFMGNLIDDFSITFKGGKAVSWKAGKNEELLGKMLTMDEGASMLGELALVPKNSPISNLGILFYNTLFDENASCHLAIGDGYFETIEGYQNMTKDELHALGVNESIMHVDFMIGADDLDITGVTRSGEEIKIFENGDWSAEFSNIEI